MPRNLAAAAPQGVLPQMRFTRFEMLPSFPMLYQPYHDSTFERSLITDTINSARVLHTWNLAARLKPTALATLRSFWDAHNGGLTPFYFYDPYDNAPTTPIGSNYDATGVSSQGRVIVVFGNVGWDETVDKARADLPFQLITVE